MAPRSSLVDASHRQAVVLRCIEQNGAFAPLTDGERQTCKALRCCGLIVWDPRVQRYVLPKSEA